MTVGRRTVTALAICCAVGGLLFAASAMPMLASEAPGGDFLADEPDDAPDRGEGSVEDFDGEVPPPEERTDPGAGAPDGSLEGEVDGSTADDTTFGSLLVGLTGFFPTESTTESPDGEVEGEIDGEGIDGEGIDGEGIDGEGIDGEVPEGEIDGEVPEGKVDVEEPEGEIDGEEPEEEETDGETPEEENETDDDEAGAGGPLDSLPALPGRALAVALALAAVVGIVATRENPTEALASIPRRLRSAALAAVVALSRAVERAVVALENLASVAELPSLLLATLSGAVAAFGRRVRAIATTGSSAVDREEALRPRSESGPEPGSEPPSARERIRRAFGTVIDAAEIPRRTASRTPPAHVSRRAKRRGAPEASVETITDSFRDVEYGGRDPDEYLPDATAAHRRLRNGLEDEDE